MYVSVPAVLQLQRMDGLKANRRYYRQLRGLQRMLFVVKQQDIANDMTVSVVIESTTRSRHRVLIST